LVFFLPVLIGVLAFAFMMSVRPSPEVKSVAEESRDMRVIKVTALDVIPRVLGYGTAEPERVWRGVSRVRGYIQETSPKLRSGSFIKKGDFLLKIDPTEYRIEFDRIAAQIKKTEASLVELAGQENNDKLSLQIEEEVLRVTEKELERNEQLFAQKSGSKAAVDAARRALLKQKQSVQVLKNRLNLVPSRKRILEAELLASRAALASAELNVGYSEFSAPFNARIAEVNLQEGQFVNVGQELFQALGTDVAEIEAQIPFSHFQKLFTEQDLLKLKGIIIQNSQEKSEGVKDLLQIEVIESSGPLQWRWPGRLAGVREKVDAKTRTYGFIVAVDDPYQLIKGKKHPALLTGSYCEVEFRGPLRQKQIVIPASAYHEGAVFVLDEQNRLRRRNVRVAFMQGDFAVIESGLAEGETLVVANPSPAFDGLLVNPVWDESLVEQLQMQAGGKVPLR